MFLGDFCKLNKTPSDGTCLGEPAGVFCDVSCCCALTSLEVFPSLLFDVIPHTSVSYCWVFTPVLYFQPSSSQSDSGYFHLNFSGLFRHSFTASATVSSGRFLPHRCFLPCTSSPHFGTFLWLRCGQKHPIQNPALCLPSQSCPFRLTHGLELLIL